MLVAALAAGELRQKIELDGQPQLTVQSSTATLELLEIKLNPDGAAECCCCSWSEGGVPRGASILGPAAAGCPRSSLLCPCIRHLMPSCQLRIPAPAWLSAEIPAAVKQLSVAANVLMYALHAANPELAAARQLHVVGQVGVAAKLHTERWDKWEGQLVDIGCAAAPATTGASMVVHVS